MSKQHGTMEEAFEAFMVDECLSSSEEEVNLETEQDFTEVESNFFDGNADPEIEIEAFPDDEEQEFSSDETIERELTPEEIAYLQFLEHGGCYCGCQANVPDTNQKLTAVIELARFGQTCTNDKQRETVLDILWMCAMDRFIK